MGLSDSHAEKWRTLRKRVASATRGKESRPVDSASHCNTVSKIVQSQKRLDEGEIEELIAAYQAGSSVRELAKHFGCHRDTVSKKIKSHGIKMRNADLTSEQVDEAAFLYASGLSLSKVGERLSAHPSTIHRRLRERGVATRRPSGLAEKYRPTTG